MTLVLAVGTDNGVLVIAPGGPSTHWQLIAQGLYGRKIAALARHPSGMLYAGAANGTVYRTRDLENWEPLFDGLKYTSVHALAIDPRDSDHMYAGTAPASLFRSRDQGRNWTQIPAYNRVKGADKWTASTPPYLSRLSSVQVHPQRPEILVTAVQNGGVMISPDAGETWFERYQGLSRDITSVALVAQHHARVYATCGIGFFRSDNLGGTWMHRMSGLPYMFTRAVVADEDDPDQVMLGVNRNKDGGPVMFRSYSGGLNWEICPSAINYQPTHSVTAMCAGPQCMFVATDGGELFGTFNFGELWSKIRPTMPPIRSIMVVNR